MEQSTDVEPATVAKPPAEADGPELPNAPSGAPGGPGPVQVSVVMPPAPASSGLKWFAQYILPSLIALSGTLLVVIGTPLARAESDAELEQLKSRLGQVARDAEAAREERNKEKEDAAKQQGRKTQLVREVATNMGDFRRAFGQLVTVALEQEKLEADKGAGKAVALLDKRIEEYRIARDTAAKAMHKDFYIARAYFGPQVGQALDDYVKWYATLRVLDAHQLPASTEFEARERQLLAVLEQENE